MGAFFVALRCSSIYLGNISIDLSIYLVYTVHMVNERKTHYIYGLIDPRTNALFYIGFTHNPEYRLSIHNQSGSAGFKKRAFIKQMRAEGFKPQMVILQKCQEQFARHLEKQWIQFSLFLGADLINEKQSTEKGVDIRERFTQYAQAQSHNKHIKKRNEAVKTQMLRLLDKLPTS